MLGGGTQGDFTATKRRLLAVGDCAATRRHCEHKHRTYANDGSAGGVCAVQGKSGRKGAGAGPEAMDR